MFSITDDTLTPQFTGVLQAERIAPKYCEKGVQLPKIMKPIANTGIDLWMVKERVLFARIAALEVCHSHFSIEHN